MDLDRWIVQPTPFEADGVVFRVAEIDLGAQARLQAWVRENVPHPVAAVRDHLAGLSPEDRAVVLEAAARDAPRWPPKIGTAEAARALLTDARGQALVLAEGLLAADPSLRGRPELAERAERLARRLNLRRNAKLSARVIGVIFGDDGEDEGENEEAAGGPPKAVGAAPSNPGPYPST